VSAEVLAARAGAPLLAAGVKASGTYVPPETPRYVVPRVGQNAVGLLGPAHQDQPLFSRLNWLHVPLLVGTPLIALYGMATTQLQARTFAFAVAYYFFSGLGITAGA